MTVSPTAEGTGRWLLAAALLPTGRGLSCCRSRAPSSLRTCWSTACDGGSGIRSKITGRFSTLSCHLTIGGAMAPSLSRSWRQHTSPSLPLTTITSLSAIGTSDGGAASRLDKFSKSLLVSVDIRIRFAHGFACVCRHFPHQSNANMWLTDHMWAS